MKTFLVALMATAIAMPAAAVTISNTPTGGNISPFGAPDTRTYGQVFTAPVTGTLTSFTLFLNGGVGALRGGVGTWNGTAAWGSGFGSPTNLYLSADVPSMMAGAYTFAPNVAVTAGSLYVAYLTAFNVAGANATTTMPLGTAASGLNYFVWNNNSDPVGNGSWNYAFNTGNVQFSATFAAIPEPQSWAMLIAGFGLVGASMRRRKAALAA